MKRILIALTVLAISALAFSSCKSHETCPAYGSTALILVDKSV